MTLLFAACAAVLVAQWLPASGWPQLVFLVALATVVVLFPVRLVAYAGDEQWILADEIQVTMIVGLIVMRASGTPTERHRARLRRVDPPSGTLTSRPDSCPDRAT